MKPVSIIGMGMGRQDLTAKHLSIIDQADILVGGRRLLENFKDLQVQRKPIGKNIDDTIDFVKEKSKRHKIVVLASGDPLFYGIGAKMAGALDANQIRIYPNINSVAAAFARLKEPWDNAAVISLHGRQNEAKLYGALEKENKVAVFTDPKKNPAWLAARLIAKEFTHFKMCVLEALGSDAERFDWYTLQKAAKMKFATPNMVVLKRSPPESDPKPKLYLGAPASWYDHQGGLITKSEIRAITLSKLQLEPHHILWDLGAGSGAISIEAALFAKRGKILAVEQDPARIEHIKNNKKRFNIRNLKIVQAILPKGLSTLPRPDRIFIGGGGKNLKTIVMQAAKYLKPGGRIVINTVLLPNLQVAKSALDQLRFETDVIQVQINRSRQMPWAERFEAQNPVWIISGFRKTKNSKRKK